MLQKLSLPENSFAAEFPNLELGNCPTISAGACSFLGATAPRATRMMIWGRKKKNTTLQKPRDKNCKRKWGGGSGGVEGGQSSKRSFLLVAPKGKIKICDIVPERCKWEKMFLITWAYPYMRLQSWKNLFMLKAALEEIEPDHLQILSSKSL